VLRTRSSAADLTLKLKVNSTVATSMHGMMSTRVLHTLTTFNLHLVTPRLANLSSTSFSESDPLDRGAAQAIAKRHLTKRGEVPLDASFCGIIFETESLRSQTLIEDKVPREGRAVRGEQGIAA
jgi:hypothetical protein